MSTLKALLPRLALRAFSYVHLLSVRRVCVVGSKCRLNGAPIIGRFPGSKLTLGNKVTLTSSSRRTALGVNHRVVLRTLTASASLNIADDVGISGGSICAAVRIDIGSGTLLGANVTITDTDFHPVDYRERRYAPLPVTSSTHSVTIGSNVFIGTGAIILKGTTIGDHSVVGAGAVVKGVFPARSVIAGNPARVIGSV